MAKNIIIYLYLICTLDMSIAVSRGFLHSPHPLFLARVGVVRVSYIECIISNPNVKKVDSKDKVGIQRRIAQLHESYWHGLDTY